MNKIILGAFSLLTISTACSEKDSDPSDETGAEPVTTLITPRIDVRMADPLSSNAFTGILEIYPCQAESSIYYGNYIDGKRGIFCGYYTIVDGDIFGEYNRELHLPAGDYNMVYWGTPKYDEPIDNSPQIVSPGLTEGADLSTLYFSLRANKQGTYSPVFDLVHAVKSAHIGTDALQASFTRIGSALKIVLKQSDGTAFIPEISNITVNIGNIAEKVNFYTAQAENMTKTVTFTLTRSDDGMSYSNPTVMLFPSGENPPLELVINLQDGTVYTLNQNLTSTLSPNTRLTLNINIGKILMDGKPGDFTIDDWNESSETIDFPIVD